MLMEYSSHLDNNFVVEHNAVELEHNEPGNCMVFVVVEVVMAVVVVVGVMVASFPSQFYHLFFDFHRVR